LHRISTNQVEQLPVGKARYSILTADDGGAIDDIIIYARPDHVLLVANAANTDVVLAHLQRHAPAEISITHRADSALIAVQGPYAAKILAPLVDVDLTKLANYSSVDAHWHGVPFVLARTGYTGEDGFELFVPASHAQAIFRELLAAGGPQGLAPAGLAARDILRLEAGMPLYGNELTATITPLQAGLDWAVRFDKSEFLGRAALLAQRESLPSKIVGLQLEDRIPARAGYAVFDGDTRVGEVRSATIAPSLEGASIATALVSPATTEIGHTLQVEIRGRLYSAKVVSRPFYRRSRI
jgi:aminomethyltransferase